VFPSEHDINPAQQQLQLGTLKLARRFGQKVLLPIVAGRLRY
jgi:hypothetical protein